MNLEDIKRKKLMEMMHGQSVQDEELKIAKQIEQIEAFARRKLTKEALERYNNLRMAYPEKAIQAAALIAQSSLSSVDGLQLKSLLQQMEPQKKETKIRRA